MSEEQQTNEAALTANETTASNSPATPQQQKSSLILKLFVFIALLIAIAASAGGVYLWQQFQIAQQSNQQQMAALESTVQNKITGAEVSRLLAQSNAAIQSDLDAIKQQLAEAAEHRKRLNESAVKLFELYGRDKNGWQLAEVEYLLRIAQHRLVIENDFEGAEKTLQAADEKLAEIADPGLLPVRVAISNERTDLQTRSRPDLVGMVLSLSRLIQQTPYLQLTTLNKAEPKAMKPAETANNEPLTFDNWQQQLQGFVSSLVKVETLKPEDKPQAVNVKDVLQVAEERLKLAKWAVLDRNQQQFKALLQQVQDMLQPYYDASNTAHVAFFQHLKELSKQEIKPQLPDISQSLLLLKRAMIQQQHVVSDAIQSVEVKQAAEKIEPQVDAPVEDNEPTMTAPIETTPAQTAPATTEGESTHE